MRKLFVLSGIALFFSSSAFAADNNCDNLVKHFPGTYKLTKRTLPDGTIITGSNLQGTLTFTEDGYRILAVVVRNPKTDAYNAASLQSRYTLSPTKFTDKLDAFTMQEGKTTDPTLYTFDKSRKSSTVVCENSILDIQNPPYDPLSNLKFNGKQLFAFADRGPLKGIVDEWKRIS